MATTTSRSRYDNFSDTASMKSAFSTTSAIPVPGSEPLPIYDPALETVVALQLSIPSIELDGTDLEPYLDSEFTVAWKISATSRFAHNAPNGFVYRDQTPWRPCTGKVIDFNSVFRMKYVVIPLQDADRTQLEATGKLKTLQVALYRRSRNTPNECQHVSHCKINFALKKEGGWKHIQLLTSKHVFPQTHVTICFSVRNNELGKASFKQRADAKDVSPIPWLPDNDSASGMSVSSPSFRDHGPSRNAGSPNMRHNQQQQQQPEAVAYSQVNLKQRGAASRTPATTGATTKMRKCLHCKDEFDPKNPKGCKGHTGTLDVHWLLLTRNVAVGLGAGVACGLGVGVLIAAKAAIVAGTCAGGGVGVAGGTVASFIPSGLSTMRYTCCGKLEGEACESHNHA
eukprot:PhF_6_TR35071/c0_g1_i1/m.51109